MADLPVAVLAGNFHQFSDFIRGKNPRGYVYISRPEVAMGRSFSTVVRIGTWYERKDRRELEYAVLPRVERTQESPSGDGGGKRC